MSMNNFTCIKPTCTNQYQTEEAEAYYCESCVEANKALAQQIDAQIASRPKRSRVSAVQEYENSQKMRIGNMQGVHIKI